MIISLIFGSNVFCFHHFHETKVNKIIPGAELITQYLHLLKSKKVGLVVNHSSLIHGTHLTDTLKSLGVNIEIIFAPEHGFRGDVDAGTTIEDGKDEKSGIKVISLYGKKYKPDPSELIDIDIIVFDIQDVGVRFYTYISTLHYIMESCAENNKPILILDRPNPNGHYIDGPVLDTAFKSFVGMHPIPIVYGLTIGELAQMIKGECWINKCENLNLKIIKCKNYTHSSRVVLSTKPSPNLPNERSILLYPSLCFFEGTHVSLGRGTSFPFQVYGHPKINIIPKFQFLPKSRSEAINPPWKDSLCFGVDLRKISLDSLLNYKKINLNYLLNAYKMLDGESSFFLKNNFFDKLAGTNQLKKQIINNATEAEIRKSWIKGINNYKSKSRKYLLYP